MVFNLYKLRLWGEANGRFVKTISMVSDERQKMGLMLRRVEGFQTGDISRVSIPKGKHAGSYLTRITSIRKTGSFSIKPAGYSKPFATNHKYCQIVRRSDDYDYELGDTFIYLRLIGHKYGTKLLNMVSD